MSNNTNKSARIKPLTLESAQGKSKELLTAVKEKLGGTPNILATMAQSPASLQAYLSLSQAIGDNSNFSDAEREQIALAIAKKNDCGYCQSAHSAIGKGAGLDNEAIKNALNSSADDKRIQGAINFAVALVEKKGFVSDQDFENAKSAGVSESDICEIIAVSALNIYTNYFNHAIQTEVDFPAPPS